MESRRKGSRMRRRVFRPAAAKRSLPFLLQGDRNDGGRARPGGAADPQRAVHREREDLADAVRAGAADVCSRLRGRFAPRGRRLVSAAGTERERCADQQREQHKTDGNHPIRFFAFLFAARRFDERSRLGAEKRERDQDREVFGKDRQDAFFIIEKGEVRAEEKIIRDVVFDQQPEADAGNDRKNRRNI